MTITNENIERRLQPYLEACDCYLMHDIVDVFEDAQHGIERVLELLAAAVVQRVFQHLLEQQLVLGDALDRLQQVRAQGKLVVQLLLAFLKHNIGLMMRIFIYIYIERERERERER